MLCFATLNIVDDALVFKFFIKLKFVKIMKFAFLIVAFFYLSLGALSAHTLVSIPQTKTSTVGCDYTIKSFSVTFGSNSRGKYVKISWVATADCGVLGIFDTAGSASWIYSQRALVGDIMPDKGTYIDQPLVDLLTELVQQELLNSDTK